LCIELRPGADICEIDLTDDLIVDLDQWVAVKDQVATMSSNVNISTRQLRGFLALSELKNFTRAAEKCCLSQPAFSALIQSIETEAGVRLFDRSTRHVELTGEGQLFEQWASRLLLDFDAAFANLKDHVTLRRGRVAISALPTIAATMLPPVLAEYHAAYPGVAIEMFDTLADASLALVREGRADLAITAGKVEHPDFEVQRLFDEPFHLVCRSDDPLLARPSLVLEDLADQPFIHMVRSSSIRQKIEAALAGIPVMMVMEVAHLATVGAMIESGLGISLLPAQAVPRLGIPNLASRALDGKPLFRSHYMIQARQRSLSAAAVAFRDMLLGRLKQE
jgi:LysR family carnitine catabolism transcriptional activator